MKQSVYSTVPPQAKGQLDTRWGVLFLCRVAVGVFYNSCRLGLDGLVSYPKHSLGWSYPFSRESVGAFYNPSSSRQGNKTFVGGESLTPLQRSSLCILQLLSADWAIRFKVTILKTTILQTVI